MHDGDELCSEPGLHIVGDMFHGGGNGIVGHERGVHDDAEAFHLEISLVQGFEGASVVEVMVKWDGKVGVSDGSDKHGIFGGGREQAVAVAMNRDVD